MDDSQVRQDIGRVEGKLEMLIILQQKSNDEQRALSDKVGTMQSDISQLKTDMASVKPHVEDYKANKNKSLGFMAALTVLGGGTGGLFTWLALTGGKIKELVQ